MKTVGTPGQGQGLLNDGTGTGGKVAGRLVAACGAPTGRPAALGSTCGSAGEDDVPIGTGSGGDVYGAVGSANGFGVGEGLGVGVRFGVGLTSGSGVTRGSGKPGSVATLITEVRFQADDPTGSPALGVGMGTGVGAIGSRPATCPRTWLPIPMPTPMATKSTKAPAIRTCENAARGPT